MLVGRSEEWGYFRAWDWATFGSFRKTTDLFSFVFTNSKCLSSRPDIAVTALVRQMGFVNGLYPQIMFSLVRHYYHVYNGLL